MRRVRRGGAALLPARPEVRQRVAAVAALVFAMPLMAERVMGYVPPPYFERFLRSLLAWAIFGAPLLALAVFASGRVWSAVVVAVATIVIAAACGAVDGPNDELWNPIFYGAPVVAIAIPLIAACGAPPRLGRVILAMIAALVAMAFFRVLAMGWNASLFSAGWPVAW